MLNTSLDDNFSEEAKKTAILSVRVADETKAMVDKLNDVWKKKLNHDLRLTVAKVLHEANFDPSVYLNPDS